MPRWLRSAGRRPAAFIAILLLSAGAALVSATTPMLVAALDAVSLREGVAHADLPADGISVTATSQPGDDPSVAEATVEGALQGAAATSDRWGAPRQVDEVQLVPRLFGPGRAPFAVRLSLAPSGCAGMRITGRCPTSVQQGLLPSSVARATGWAVGTVVVEKTPNLQGVDPPYFTIGRFTVVGVYDDTRGLGPVLADPTRLEAAAAPRPVFNVVVGPKDVERLGAPVQVTGAVRIAEPVAQADLPALRRGVVVAERAVLGEIAASTNPEVVSGLGALLDSIAAQQAAAAVLATPVGLAAVLLAWFALGAVAQRTSRSRAAEWGVGRMRGARIRAWLATVFVEPLLAVLLGAALGYALALVVARLAAAALLGTAGDVAPLTAAVLVGAGLAVAGSVVALAAASVRAALLPLPQLVQDTAEPRRLTRASLVLQVALVAVALAAGWAALTTTSLGGQQLGLLLPALLAFVVGVVAVRAAVLLVRRGVRRAPRSLGDLIVVRSVARAPSVLVSAQLVLVSAALGAFALQIGLLSVDAQTDRAQLAVGAARVLAVEAPSGSSLVDLVRRADPSGRVAMAAEQVAGQSAGPGGKVLAVDAGRLAAVSSWPAGQRGGIDVARLASGGAEPQVVGTRLTLTMTGSFQASKQAPGPTSVQLLAELGRPDGWTAAYLGPIGDGTVQASIPCASGCRLVSFGLYNAKGSAQPWRARFTITAVSTDRQSAAVLQPWLRADRWRNRIVDESDPTRPASARPVDSSSGLSVVAADSEGADTAQLEPAVGPEVVPAVLGSDARLAAFPGVPSAVVGTSLAGTPILMRPVGHVVAVPRALRTGVLVDLGEMLRVEDPSLIGAQQQVWLAPSGQARVVAALRAEGVRVIGDERAADAVTTALDSPTNRAILLAGVTALVALAFGLLALVATRVVDMEERRREWAVLRLVGVPAARLRRLALVQGAVPSVLGAVLGVAAGSVAAVLVADRLPLFVGVSAGAPLDLAVPVGPLAALAGVLVVLVLVAAAAVTAVEVRRIR